MDIALRRDKKLAVHCHAGRGRTGLVICGYLMLKKNWSAQKSIDFFRSKRTHSLKKKSQLETLINLEIFLKNSQKLYFW